MIRVVLGATVLMSLLAAAPAQAQWGTALYTEDGVEIAVDARVASLFSMLNLLGYNTDTVLGPPPLMLPQHSETRKKTRSALGRPGAGTRALQGVIEKNPAPLSTYVRAVLELGPAPKFDPAPDASALAKAMAEPVRVFFNEDGGAQAVRVAAESGGKDMKALLPQADKAMKALTKLVRMGDAQDQLLDDTGADGRVSIAFNELDAHGTLSRVDRPGFSYVVAGPTRGAEDTDRILDAAALAYARTLLVREVQKQVKGPNLGDAVTEMAPAVKEQLKDSTTVSLELLACAFMREVRGATRPCAGSVLFGDPAAERLLAELQPRVSAFAKDTTLLADALPTLAAPAAPPAPAPAPAAPEPAPKSSPKKTGGK